MRKKQPRIYFTSDWHLFHANSIKFDNRPFEDVNHMTEVLVKNFNRVVDDNCITYFLGDMGMGKNESLAKVINRLNGTKVLIRGNHDGKMYSMYNAGFDVVLEKGQISVGKHIITMTHCPLKGVFREDTTGMRGSDGSENWHGEKKNGDTYSIEDFGQFHLHGHIHSGPDNIKPKIDGKQFDVGVPANDYKPVPLSYIESWINSYSDTNK